MQKSEKEKMLTGEPYNCGDKELTDRWHLAKKITRDYNSADTTDQALLNRLLDELLGSKGKGVWIAPPFFVDYGENIYLGNYCEINMNCVFLDCNTITLGDHCGIGPGVHMYTVFHPVDAKERLVEPSGGRFSFWNSQTASIVLGDNVWIGGNSVILPGITIGSNTTIGAGSVVSRSIPSDCLAVGNPCRVIKWLK